MAKLDPEIEKYVKNHGCSEIEAANQLGFNLDDIYDYEDDDEDEDD